MLAPSGTHCTRVGSSSLQISDDWVTPVVAYPSGQVPQVILILLGSVASSARLTNGTAATNRAPTDTVQRNRLATFHLSNRIILPPCKFFEPFTDELLQRQRPSRRLHRSLQGFSGVLSTIAQVYQS